MDKIASLESYIDTTFENGKKNRAVLRDKWTNNLNAFLRKAEGIWAKDTKATWRSGAMDGATRNKVLSFLAIMVDVFLRGGKIPFDLDPSPSELGRSNMSILQARDAFKKDIDDASDLINEVIKKTNIDRELIKNFLAFGLYGNTYGKMIVDTVTDEWLEPKAVEGIEDASRLPAESKSWEKRKKSRKVKTYIYRPNWSIIRDMESPIDKCAYVFDYGSISITELRRKKGQPGYIDSQIDYIISKNPQTSTSTASSNGKTPLPENEMAPVDRDIAYREKTLLHTEYWGKVPKDKFEEFKDAITEPKSDQWLSLITDKSEREGDMVEVTIEAVDKKIIKVTEVDIEDRPFIEAETMMNPDGKGAQGVADNIEMDQLIKNRILRSLIDNKHLAANVILAMKREFLEEEIEDIYPGVQLNISAECDDARKALQQVTIQDITQGLDSLFSIVDDMTNANSMIPEISQGIGLERPETAYEASKRVEQASKFMGLNVRQFDEGIIEPMISAIHQYNIEDPDITKGKGDFVVHVKGYAAYQDAIIRVEMLQRWLSIILSNESMASKYKLEKINNDIGLSMSLDVMRYEKSPEELAQEQQAMAEQPNPEIEVAQSQVMKNKAEVEAMAQKSLIEQERLNLDKARLISDVQMKNKQQQQSVAQKAAPEVNK